MKNQMVRMKYQMVTLAIISFMLSSFFFFTYTAQKVLFNVIAT